MREANAVAQASPAVIEAKRASRRSSLLLRRSMLSAPAVPSEFTNGKSLRASRHAPPARTRTLPASNVPAPSIPHAPNAPLVTLSTGARALVSAIVPPTAPLPAPPSAPGVRRTPSRSASGRSAASAVPVAGSLSGTPSSVTSTCSARAPRNCQVVSPCAERDDTPGMEATSAASVGCALARVSATDRYDVKRAAGSPRDSGRVSDMICSGRGSRTSRVSAAMDTRLRAPKPTRRTRTVSPASRFRRADPSPRVIASWPLPCTRARSTGRPVASCTRITTDRRSLDSGDWATPTCAAHALSRSAVLTRHACVIAPLPPNA